MTTSIPLQAAGSESGSFRSARAALALNPIRSEWFEFGAECNANRMALLKQTAGNYFAEVTRSSNNQDHRKLKGI
jgi:hypothetical protein